MRHLLSEDYANISVDGLRGPLIVHDPEDPHKDLYDEEVVITLSDWYHDQMENLLKGFINVANPSGAEPVPQAALMNDTQNLAVKIQPGKTYLFRLINMGAFAAQYVWFEGHTMRIVEVDGVYTEPMNAEMIYLTAAQRYSVLVTAKNDTNSNFAFVGSMDQVRSCMSTSYIRRHALIVTVGSFR
jgi:iron transport multicopper oxidase